MYKRSSVLGFLAGSGKKAKVIRETQARMAKIPKTEDNRFPEKYLDYVLGKKLADEYREYLKEAQAKPVALR